MALPSLPAKGSDDWYAHYAALDADVRGASGTYRAKANTPIDARGDFGVLAGDLSDYTVRMQSFLDAVKAEGRPGVLPPGTIPISGTLLLDQVSGWDLAGAAPGIGTGGRTALQWIGAAGGAMLKLNGVRNGGLRRIALLGNSLAAIGLDYDASAGGVVTTLNKIDQLYVSGCTDRNVRIAKSAFQADQTDWHSCSFRGAPFGVSVEDANAVWHSFYGCEFHTNGVGITAQAAGTGGHFDLYGCRFVGQTTHDIQVYPGRATVLSGCKSEGGQRFLVGPASSTAVFANTTLVGCDVNGITAADQQGIQWHGASPLNIVGGRYRSNQASLPFKIRGTTAGGAARGQINALGVSFPDGDPFVGTSASSSGTLVAQSCVYGTGSLTHPASVSGVVPRLTPATALSLTNATGTTAAAGFAARMWVRIPSGAVLTAGVNTFLLGSKLCNGLTAVEIRAITRHGGSNGAPVLLGITAFDDNATNPQFARIDVRVSAAVTLNDNITFCVQFEPEPATY